jgi:hypothetical protein
MLDICLGQSGQFGKTGRVGDGEIRQDFSVNLYPGRFQSMDKLAVRKSVYPGSGINAGNQSALKSLFLTRLSRNA